MEDGGSSLFDFCKAAHGLIQKGVIQISHWKNVIRVIFMQMLQAIEYLHSKNVCHFDVSLENFLINDCEIQESSDGKKTTIQFNLDKICVKLCDFGMLSQHKYILYLNLYFYCILNL